MGSCCSTKEDKGNINIPRKENKKAPSNTAGGKFKF